MKDALVAASMASPGPWAAQPQQQPTLNGMFDRMRYEVYKYACEHLDHSAEYDFPFTEDTVYIVWSCKTLQNWKALISTSLSDGMYYDVHTTETRELCTSMLTKNLITDRSNCNQ